MRQSRFTEAIKLYQEASQTCRLLPEKERAEVEADILYSESEVFDWADTIEGFVLTLKLCLPSFVCGGFDLRNLILDVVIYTYFKAYYSRSLNFFFFLGSPLMSLVD